MVFIKGGYRSVGFELQNRHSIPVLALAVVCLLVSVSSAQVSSGTYVGDGSYGRLIDGIGFRPDVVILKADAISPALISTSDMPAGSVKSLADIAALDESLILSLTDDGFTVSDQSEVNQFSVRYDWVAFKNVPGMLSLGSYTGELNDINISGLGFQPDCVMVMSAANYEAYFRTAEMPPGFSATFRNKALRVERIKSFEADGFTVGQDLSVNAVDVVSHYVAWKAAPGQMTTGMYIGDGMMNRDVSDLDLDPVYLLLKSAANEYAVHRSSSLGHENLTMATTTAPHYPFGIIDMYQGGFMTGFLPEVNQPGEPLYWASFAKYQDLSLTLSANQNPILAGDTIQLTLKLENLGPGTADSTVIDFPIPEDMNFLSADVDSGSYDSDTGIWSVASLVDGDIATLVLTLETSEEDAGTVATAEAAIISTDHFDQDSANDTQTLLIPIMRTDLSLGLSLSEPVASVGDSVTLGVTVINDGPNAASSLQSTISMPAGMAYVSSDANQGAYDWVTGIWTLGGMAAADTATLDLVLQVDSTLGGPVFDLSAILDQGIDWDPDLTDNDALVQLQITSTDLALSLIGGQASLDVGDTLSYTVKLDNLGPDPADMIVVTPALSGLLTIVSQTPSQGVISAETGKWEAGAVAVMGNATLDVVAVVDAGSGGQTLAYAHKITAMDRVDSDPTNNTVEDTVYVSLVDLALDFLTADSAADPGDTLVIRLEALNNGPDIAGGALVDLDIPVGLDYVGVVLSGGSYDAPTDRWSLPALGNSESRTLDLSVVVLSGYGGTSLEIDAAMAGLDQEDQQSANDIDTFSVTIRSADLSVSKIVDNLTPNVGSTVLFTVRVDNHGPDSATGIVINDLLPAGLDFVNSLEGQGTYDELSGDWVLGDLAADAFVILQINARVPVESLGMTLINTAAISLTDQEDPIAGNNSSSVSISVRSADIEVQMSVVQSELDEGETAQFDLTITNHGPDPATGLEILDLLPVGLDFSAATASRGAYNPLNGEWAIGSLAVDETVTLALDAVVAAGTSGTSLLNSAAVTASDQGDPNALNNEASANVTVTDSDLKLIKLVDHTLAVTGDTITYTIKLINDGPDDVGMSHVSDPLPEGLALLNATTEQGTYVVGTGLWTVGAIAAGDTLDLVIECEILETAAQGSMVNTATVDYSDVSDPLPGNNEAIAAFVVSNPDLRPTLVVDDPNPNEGGNIAYTLTLVNDGGGAVSNAQVTVTWPAGLSLNLATPSQGSYDSGTGVWSVGSLGGGASCLMLLTAVVDPGTGGQTLSVDVASASLNETDSDPANDAASADLTVQSADLSLGKSVDNAAPLVNDMVDFTVSITNLGPSAATSVVVNDLLPAGLSYQSHTVDRGAYDSGTGDWVLGNVAMGDSLDLVITAQVLLDVDLGDTAVNTAQITGSDQADPVAGNNLDTAILSLQSADMTLALNVDEEAPRVGDDIVFTIDAENLGPADATGVEVSGLLPSGLSFQSASADQGSYDSGSGVWDLGALANGETTSLQITAQVAAGQAGEHLEYQAAYSAILQADPIDANNQALQAVDVLYTSLGLDHYASDLLPDSGELVDLGVDLHNAGPDTAFAVQVLALPPLGLDYQSAIAEIGAYDDATGLWDIGTVAPGDTVSLTVSVEVSAAGGSSLLSSASISAGQGSDPDLSDNADSISLSITSADLDLVVNVNNPAPDEGDAVAFTLSLRNLGPDPATGIVVSDLLPVGIDYVSNALTLGAYDPVLGQWSLGDLANGALATLVLNGTIAEGTAGEIIDNTATVTQMDQDDPAAVNNTADATVTVRNADLQVTQTGSHTVADIGDTLSFNIEVENLGPDVATGIEIFDILPAGLTYLSNATSQGGYSRTTGQWNLGTLVPGSIASLDLEAVVQSGTVGETLINVAGVSSVDQGDAEMTNNQDSVSVLIQSLDLQIDKTISQPNPAVGDTVSYVITLTNLGPTGASEIVVEDILPAGLLFISAVAESGDYDDADGHWGVPALANGQVVTLTIEAAVEASAGGATITNTAAILSLRQADSNPANDLASVDLYVASADLALSFSLAEAAVDVGDTTTFTIEVSNGGPDDAGGIIAEIDLPAGLTGLTGTTGTGTYDSGTGIWDLGSLADGSSATLLVPVRIEAAAAGSILYPGAQLLAAVQDDPVSANDQDSAALQILAADIGLALSVDTANPNVGQTITLTCGLSSSGPDANDAVLVENLLPAGLDYVSHTVTSGVYDSISHIWDLGVVPAHAGAVLVLRAQVTSALAGLSVDVTTQTADSDRYDPDPANNTDTVSLDIMAADLEVAISASRLNVDVGDTVTVSVDLQNLGADAASGAILAFAPPSGMSSIAVRTDAGSYDPSSGYWVVGSIPNAVTVNLEMDCLIEAVAVGEILVLSAAVQSVDQADPEPLNNSDTLGLTVSSANLQLSGTVDLSTPDVGDTVEYIIELANAGPDDATGISVDALLPGELDYIDHLASSGLYDPPSGLWTPGDLPASQNHSLSVRASVPAAAAGRTIDYEMAVTAADQADPNAEDDSHQISIQVRAADVAVGLSLDLAAIDVGDTATFTIEAINRGPNAVSGLTISHDLPAGLTVLAGTAQSGVHDPLSGLWTIPALAFGDTTYLVLPVIALSAGAGASVDLTAQISGSDQADTDPGNDLASEPLQILAANLEISGVVDLPTPDVGDQVTFTIELHNLGPDDDSGVTVSSVLPEGLSYVSHSLTNGSYDPISEIWDAGPITATSAMFMILRATVDSTAVGQSLGLDLNIENSTRYDPDPVNNSATIQVDVTAADLAVSLSSSLINPDVGDTLTIGIDLQNLGPDTADAVVLSVLTPAGLSRLAVRPGVGSYDPLSGLWTVGSILDGQTVNLEMDALVEASTVGQILSLSAAVQASDQADPVAGNNSDTLNLGINSADLQISGSVDDDAPNVGDSIVYTIALDNAGPDDASGIELGALVPAGLLYSGYSATAGLYDPLSGLWTVASLPSGITHTLTLAVVVQAEAAGLDVPFALAITASDQADPLADDNTLEIPLHVQASDLALRLGLDKLAVDVGDTATFNVTVINQGPDPVTGLEITHGLPAGLTFMTGVPDSGSHDELAGLWTLPALAAGDSAHLALPVLALADSAGSGVGLNAQITGADQADTESLNNQAQIFLQILAADLELSGSADHPTPDVGEIVSFTIELNNLGPDADTGVQATATLPAGLSYDSHTTSNGSYDPLSGIWDIGDVAVLSGKIMILRARVDSLAVAQTLDLDVALTAWTRHDSDPSNNDLTISISVKAVDLQLLISASQTSLDVGDTVMVVLDLGNDGPDDASSVEVMYAPPAGQTLVSVRAASGSFDVASSTWSIGALAAGDSTQLEIDCVMAPAAAGLVLENIATITDIDQADPDPTDNESRLNLTVRVSDLMIRGFVDLLNPNVGDTVIFSFVLTNPGPDSATGLVIEAPLPEGLEFTDHSASSGSFDPVGGIWTLGAVNAGVDDTLAVRGVILEDAAGDALTYSASIIAVDQADPNTENNEVDLVVTVQITDLQLDAILSSETCDAGDTVQLSLVLRNAGPDDATGLGVWVPVPEGLAITASTPGSGSFDSASGLWTPAALAAAASDTLLLDIQAAAGTIGAVLGAEAAIVAQDQAESAAEDNVAAYALRILSADLHLRKEVDEDHPDVGDVITIMTTLMNMGPDGAVGVAVSDSIPEGLAYVSHTISQGDFDPSSGLWTVGSLGHGAAVLLITRLEVLPDRAGDVVLSRAILTAGQQADPKPEDNVAELLITIQGVDLSLELVTDTKAPQEQDEVQVTVTIRNLGPDAADRIVVQSEQQEGLILKAFGASKGLLDPETGLWTIDRLAAGDSTILNTTLEVAERTGGTVLLLSAAIIDHQQLDLSDGNDADSVALSVGIPDEGHFLASAEGLITGVQLPGSPAADLFSLDLINWSVSPDTLKSIEFNNTTTGPGTTADLDGNWSTIELWRFSTPRVYLGEAVFAEGSLVFSDLGLLIASGDTLALGLVGGASLNAHDGDLLGLGLADANGLVFGRPIIVDADWPLALSADLPVDGLSSHQLRILDIEAAVLPSGSFRNPVLGVTVPRNGYAATELQGVTLMNLGTAVGVSDITRVDIWRDSGDQVFVDGEEIHIGEAAFTGSRWILSDLSLAIPVGGLDIFCTVDLDAEATSGATIRMALPTGSDPGLTLSDMCSGPVDLQLANAHEQVISTTDRIYLSAVDLPDADVRPGQQDVPLLQLAMTNTYTSGRSLSGLILTTDIGDSSEGSALLAGIELLAGVGDDSEPVLLGTGRVAGNRIDFGTLDWTVPPNGSGDLYLRGAITLSDAADSDSLCLLLAGGLDLSFADQTGLVAKFPVSSGGWIHLDGMVAAQITALPVPVMTLSGGDGPVVAMDLILPADGTRSDRLEALVLENTGSATPTDIASLRLWADDGDGLFGGAGGGDTELGSFLPVGDSWSLESIDADVPSAGLRIFVTAEISDTPTDSHTLKLQLPVGGVTMASDNDGPRDLAILSSGEIQLSDSPLLATLSLDHERVTVGESLIARMVIRNVGLETIEDIRPAVPGFAGSGALSIGDGPAPAVFTLAAGDTGICVWTLLAAAPGSVLASNTCSGTGAVGGSIFMTPVTSSAELAIYAVPATQQVDAVPNLPFSINRGQQGVNVFSLMIDNPELAQAAPARLDALRLTLRDGGGNPLPAPGVIDWVELKSGSQVYAHTVIDPSDTALILIPLTRQTEIPSGDALALTLSLGMSADGDATSFALELTGADAFTLVDAISGDALPVARASGNFPITTGVASLVFAAENLQAAADGAEAYTAGRAQVGAVLMALDLINATESGATASLQVGKIAVSLLDSNGALIGDPSRIISALDVSGAGDEYEPRLLTAMDDTTIVLEMSPPLTLVSGAVKRLLIRGDITADCDLARYHLRIGDPSAFDVRDINSGVPVAVDPVGDSETGGPVTIQDPAAPLIVSSAGTMPDRVPRGSEQVEAMTLYLRNSGVRTQAATCIDTLMIRIRDNDQNTLVMSDCIQGLRVELINPLTGEKTVAGRMGKVGKAAGAIPIVLDHLLLPAGGTVEMMVVADLLPFPSTNTLEFVIAEAGVLARDANLDSPVAILPGPGIPLPFTSGVTILQTPATAMVVSFADDLPVSISAITSSVPIGRLSLENPGGEATSEALFGGVTIRAADDEFQSLAIGAVAREIRVRLGDEIIFGSGELAATDSLAVLAGLLPMAIPSGEPIELLLEMVPRADVTSGQVRFGFTQDDIEAAQPYSISAPLSVEAELGAAFPFWTQVSSFVSVDLSSSYANFPNPFAAGREATTFTYSLRQNARVTLEIYTPHGDRVRTLCADQPKSPGSSLDDIWDGRNGKGQAVANGVYIAVLQVTFEDGVSERLLRKVAVVR